MEYIKAEQKINGCTLECSVTAKGESLSYAYYLYLNDQRIINTGYSTSNSISFPLEKFGRYHSTVFIRDPEGNKIIKELSPLDYWETHVLLVDSPFTKSAFSQLPQPVEISICPWNQRIETLPVPESFPNTSIDFLLLDLLGPASDFAASHAGMLQALRSADPAASLIPATPVQKELLEFLQKTKIFLEKLQKQYGTKKIILLEPLFPFENASEWQLNVNWVLEEIYSFSKTAGLHTIPLPGAVLPGRPKPACRSSNADIIYQQIEKYNREKYLPKAEIREISVCLEGNRLTATILYNGDVREGAVFHFYLLLDGRILVKELGMKQPVQSWELEQSGIYVVQGYIRHMGQSVFSYSQPVEFFTADSRQRFQEFISSFQKPGELIGQQPDLCFSKYPYGDFLLLSQKEGTAECFTEEQKARLQKHFPSLSHYELPSVGHYANCLLTSCHLKKGQEGACLFSGIAYSKGRLVIGEKDLAEPVNSEDLFESAGSFSMVHILPDSITLSTDFFGLTHLFFYAGKEGMVIANQYHLLLEALSALGIKLQLQLSKAALILSSVTLPILSQNFSLEMDMEGVRQLSVLRLLRLTPEGWQELPNSCGMLLSSREVYHEEAYRKMLLLARSELLGNMRMMLEDKRFDICSVDLSGGLDSRMVYGMLTNFPEYREHACIISRDVPGSRDLQIASSINMIYGYPYYALPVHFYRIPVKKMDQLFRSVKLGTYYCGNPAWDYREPNRELNLSGACGEIVSRPYFARNYFDMPKPDPSLSELLQFVATKSSPYVMVDGKVFQLFQKLFMKEIAEIPGSSAFEKFDKHYLLFRNSYHFGDNRYDALIDRNGAIPLLSKWMFRLHHMSFDAFRSIKLQLDMIYQLNRELAFIPYDDERDNRDFDRLAPQLYMPEGCLPKRQLCDMPNDLDSWKCAQQESRQATRRDTSQLNQLQLEEYRHLPQMVLNSLFYNFYLLMRRFPALQEQVGPAVYHYILQNQSDSKKIRSLYNRVTSLLDQVRIFDRCQADGQ